MRSISLAVLSIVILACDSGGFTPRRDVGGGREMDATTQGDSSGNQDSRPLPDADFNECAAESVQAETTFQPVDVVWVVDSSGSMRGEARIVQDNINNFAQAIAGSEIDVHVVMITTTEYVSVPPPLGTDPERFLHVERGVGSNASLSALISAYPQYSAFLREDAALHFVIVTDDETSMRPDAFETQMRNNVSKDFKAHVIASPPGSTGAQTCLPIVGCIGDDACTGPNGDAADNGDRYWALADSTGGEKFSICTGDWSALFTTLTDAIAVPQPLPCRFVLPEPPDGSELDRNRVNVIYTPTGGTERTIPFVESSARCSGDGWYFEGDAVLVCPNTCNALTADMTGKVDIAFGCATQLL